MGEDQAPGRPHRQAQSRPQAGRAQHVPRAGRDRARMPARDGTMTAPKPYYITTAIAYVNGLPHLGHAYEVISTDVMARFKRLDGYDVYFVTGTDEHGQKVAKSAAAAGKEPKAFCDEISLHFKKMDALLDVSYDRFIRTTEEAHYRASQAIWQRIADAEDIYLGK